MSDETKQCPHCAKTIKAEAIFCRYCRQDIPVHVSFVISSSVPPTSQEQATIQEQNTASISEPILEPIKKVEEEVSVIKSDGESKSNIHPLSKEPKKNVNQFLKIALMIGLLGGVVLALSCGILVRLYYFDSSSPIYRFWDNYYIDFGFPTSVPTAVPATSAPYIIEPTSDSFIMPKGDFEMSWDIYSSEYNSLGGIVTIRRQGSKYTEKLVMSDGSSGTYPLTVISEGSEIKLTDRPGNSYGDYMIISKDGYLHFYDNQGLIYSVPPLK